jgi:hypothetical protein
MSGMLMPGADSEFNTAVGTVGSPVYKMHESTALASVRGKDERKATAARTRQPEPPYFSTSVRRPAEVVLVAL